MKISVLEDVFWDFIVIGTGMGGAVAGAELARAGARVLFCEAGMSSMSGARALRGNYAEAFGRNWQTLRESGRSIETLRDRSREIHAFLGMGTGGSTSLYGMALERFFPSDFQPARKHPKALGSALPERWPITWEELEPFYQRAERLFRVRGEADPLKHEQRFGYLEAPDSGVRPLDGASRRIREELERRGQHPYQLPLACEFVPDCKGCQGFLCAFACKNDATRICIEPAVKNHGAGLLEDCRVIGLEADREQVTRVHASLGATPVILRGATVILAAGGIGTPRILLESKSPDWLQGLANESGQVGRNLMRHLVDLYVLRSEPSEGGVASKALAFNDFYDETEYPLGTVQSFGELPPPGVIVTELDRKFRIGKQPARRLALRLFRRPYAALLGRLVSRRPVLATVLEDLPYAENRVVLGESGVEIRYSIRPYEKRRVREFRRRMNDLFRRFHPLLLKNTGRNEMLAHACGTCRFGDDPRTSVLDRWNRAHGLKNLYVVDSSFFPSSGGTNPALTIAANALRVAARIQEVVV